MNKYATQGEGRFKPVHGMSGGKGVGTYETWRSMRQRCLNPKHKSFPKYGGRGILVCARWDDFQNFFEDMGPRLPGTSLGRVDNAKGYEPGNCRWETMEQQQNNRRSNRVIEAFGRRQTLTQWAREFGLRDDTLAKRLDDSLWTIERALTTPVAPNGGKLRKGERLKRETREDGLVAFRIVRG